MKIRNKRPPWPSFHVVDHDLEALEKVATEWHEWAIQTEFELAGLQGALDGILESMRDANRLSEEEYQRISDLVNGLIPLDGEELPTIELVRR